MHKLLKIGDVSKLCNISIKTLRYYEEIGLITPVEVDIYSGYRYYNEENINTIYKIQLLKDLGFSLAEIRDFDEKSLKKKSINIKKQISELKRQIKFISSLQNLKGEKIMKPFINDPQAVGKWSYVCSAISKEAYDAGDVVEDKDILFDALYFLPNGKGYWVFDRWTKDEIYHFSGVVYKYSIQDEKLLLEICNQNGDFEILLIYKKVDSKEYSIEDIKRKDDVNIDFVKDEKVIGFWDCLGYMRSTEKNNFSVGNELKQGLFKSLSFKPNGEVVVETQKGIIKAKWSDGVFIHEGDSVVMKYELKQVDGKNYMFLEWKSGDYMFSGKIFDFYVFEKM